MPKKRTFNFKQLQGSSSSSTKASSENGGGANASPSVNERLSELRKLESSKALQKKRELAESVNQRSVPPELRGVLGVPESAPPRPKAHVRTRDRMRTPGPAPPKSWLGGGIVAGRSALMLRGRRGIRRSAGANDLERNRPKQLLRFARLSGLEYDGIDQKPSNLTHLTLKRIAESWLLLEEDDYPALVEIPLRLRLRLLSYIDSYGPAIDAVGLQALLQGTEEIRQLDLASLVGHGNLTLKKIMRFIERDQEKTSGLKAQDIVADSWDAEDTFEATLQASIRVNRFSQLTHLCLSHPAANASWRDLLALSKHIPQVTHLSLAYWPRPTLTPNLATTTVASHHSPDVIAGGSHYYSSLDKDLSEPASLLRQLSSNLLCLQWLDLEGCSEWALALIRLAEDTTRTEEHEVRNDDMISATTTAALPVFMSNWKLLTFLRVAQGWLPSSVGVCALQQSRGETGRARTELLHAVLQHLEATQIPVNEPSHDLYNLERTKAQIWFEAESTLQLVGRTINSLRRKKGIGPVILDCGWRRTLPLSSSSQDQ